MHIVMCVAWAVLSLMMAFAAVKGLRDGQLFFRDELAADRRENPVKFWMLVLLMFVVSGFMFWGSFLILTI